MTYTKQTWVDDDPIGHPVSAARMGVLEQGVFDAHYRPSVRVYRSTTQAIPDSTFTTISYDSERWDTDPTGMHSAGQPSRIVFQQSGIYHVIGQLLFAASATGIRALQIIRNGVTTGPLAAITTSAASAGSGSQLILPMLIQATAGDYIELRAYQSTGSSMTLSAGTSTDWSVNDFQAALASF